MVNVFDINYSKLVSDHSLTLNATYRIYRDQAKWKVDSVAGFELDEIDKLTDGYVRGSNAIFGEAGNVVRDINSLIVHAKYSFKNKYTVSAFANYDRLQEGNYIAVKALFPSIAVNWDLSKETGLNTIKNLNELSIYANWGKSGNYPLNGLSNDLYAKIKFSDGYRYDTGTYISNLANHHLKHEEVEEKNLGILVRAFQNQLTINANYYIKSNRDLIINREIPFYYGGGRFMKNLGEMYHKGLEISIESNVIENYNFLWNTVIGYSHDKQHVKRIYQDQDTLFFMNDEYYIPSFYVAKNSQIGDILGYKYEGYWSEADEELQNNQYINHEGIKYYKNDTTTNTLSEKDYVVIGNSVPDFTFHWINDFRYKNINMYMHWYGVVGVDKFNSTRASTYYSHLNEGIRTFVNDSMSHYMDHVFYESSYFIEDASFIRLKTLGFSYAPMQPVFGNVKAVFSLSFENLITFTRYKGYDPEATIYTDNNFSNNSLDIGAYPSSISVFFGVDLTF